MNQDTIRLLILNDSRPEAERLISMLQNAGKQVRAQHVETPEALSKLLQEKLWDLMIATDGGKIVPTIDAVKQIRRLNKDIPIIIQTDREGSRPRVEGIKLGARDVVELDEDQHLLVTIDRELTNREEREKRRYAERRFSEVSRRNQSLLDSSRDAIAFLQDGMFLYANYSFAELLSYDNRDDLECISLIDIVPDAYHDKLKRFLKEYMLKGSDIDATELKLKALSAKGEERLLDLEVRKDTFEDEPCIQFVVRASNIKTEKLEAQIAVIKTQDSATGLYNKSYMVDVLGKLIDKAVAKEYNSALLHIGIQNFSEMVADKVGVGSTDTVLKAIASHCQSLVKKTDILCRFTDDSFILVAPKINAYKAQERANELGQQMRDHVVDIEGKTLHFNYHIGIAVINETSTDPDTPIGHSLRALELARETAKEDPNVVSSIYEPDAPQDDETNMSDQVADALRLGKFKLLFQPILSLRGSDKEHYEVLLRMIDNDGELISPNDFLSTALRIGALTKIDRWVILESIKLLSEHQKNGHNTRLLINLSQDSLADKTLTPWLKVAFKAADLSPESIIFQLREVDINDHLNFAVEFSKQLEALGCHLSISHFGCAMNPFKALESVKSNYIKVDGSFTQDIQNNDTEEAAQSLNELVSELHQQDKITIVPFVENASVLSKLWQSGVHYIQGFYLHGPSPEMNYDFDMES